MLPRFFAPDANEIGALVSLSEDEATHLTRVLRLAPGARVKVFDGRGREWLGEVAEAGRTRANVRLLEMAVPAPEPRIAIHLALAALKGDKMDDVVRDAVMLGAAAITPLVTARGEIGLAALQKGRRQARWQRIAVSSAKQCGRAVVPPIAAPAAFGDHLATPSARVRVMLVEPSAAQRVTVQDLASLPAADVEVIVGPEGGWTDQEIEAAAAAGAILVTLGARTLRADAVPIVALSALRALWNDL